MGERVGEDLLHLVARDASIDGLGAERLAQFLTLQSLKLPNKYHKRDF